MRIQPIVMFVIIPMALIIISILLPVAPAKSISSTSDYWTTLFGNITSTAFWTEYVIAGFMGFTLGVTYGKEMGELFSRLKNRITEGKALVDSNFLTNLESEDTLIELSFIEKIAYVSIPIIIFLNLLYFIGYYNPNIWDGIFKQFFGGLTIERLKLIVQILDTFFVPISLFFIFFISSSYRFYFAKLSFIVAQEKESKFDKMKYYMRALKEYNKFLSRNLHFQLDELKIYSKILSSRSIDDDFAISSFDDSNKLKPLVYFTNFTRTDELLMRVTKIQKVKESIEFAVTILPIVFIVLVTLFPAYTTTLRELLK